MTLNKAQQAAVDSVRPTILAVAGPGSGKTHTIIERVRRLVASGTRAEALAVITYTNAAANELTRRLDPIKPGYCGTLHSFCLRLLQANADAMNLPARIGIVDEAMAEKQLAASAAAMKYKGTGATLKLQVGRGPFATMNTTPTVEELAARHFHATLGRAGLMTFDSLLYYGLRLLEQHEVAVPYEHLLVDEYQDAAWMDTAIYRALPVANRFFVGDPDQAIYAFRGGDIGGILELASERKTEVHKLEANYRSDLWICAAAQALINHNGRRIRKAIMPASAAQGLAVGVRFDDAIAEATWLARRLRDGDPQQAAVLVRTNRLVAHFAQLLQSQGIPVAVKRPRDIPADWPAARNFIALLNDPTNDTLAEWFIAAKHGGTVARDARLKATAAGETLNDTALNIPRDIPLGDVWQVMARAQFSHESCAAMRASIADLPPGSTVGDLLLALAVPHEAEVGQGVTVSTIHSAKGREWDRVFLPAFEQHVIPGGGPSRDIEEERRLAYVGITRARHQVIVSWCSRRKPDFGGLAPIAVVPSQFVAEAALYVTTPDVAANLASGTMSLPVPDADANKPVLSAREKAKAHRVGHAEYMKRWRAEHKALKAAAKGKLESERKDWLAKVAKKGKVKA